MQNFKKYYLLLHFVKKTKFFVIKVAILQKKKYITLILFTLPIIDKLNIKRKVMNMSNKFLNYLYVLRFLYTFGIFNLKV